MVYLIRKINGLCHCEFFLHLRLMRNPQNQLDSWYSSKTEKKLLSMRWLLSLWLPLSVERELCRRFIPVRPVLLLHASHQREETRALPFDVLLQMVRLQRSVQQLSHHPEHNAVELQKAFHSSQVQTHCFLHFRNGYFPSYQAKMIESECTFVRLNKAFLL